MRCLVQMGWVCLVLTAGLLAGCVTTDSGVTPGGTNVVTTANDPEPRPSDHLARGMRITVAFLDVPNPPPPVEQAIREDGFISLPFNIEIKAADRTRGELVEAIEKAYVPKYFRRLSINLKVEALFFYVSGHVRSPGRQTYLGDITVLKAIQSAGDFTDFGNEKKVEVTRANGRKFKVNCKEARKRPELDLPIYPGDQIHVPRRYW